MKKNFLQDVIPASQKRSIRDIPLPIHKERKIPQTHKRVSDFHEKKQESFVEEEFYKNNNSVFESNNFHQSSVNQVTEEQEEYPKEKNIPNYPKRKKTFMKKTVFGISALIMFCSVLFFSRTEATITLTPKKVTSEILSAIPVTDGGQLSTKTQITNTLSKTLLATAEQQVEKQASGRIKIINKHKEDPQELVKNTRFQTSNGLIYRIRDSIVVPGYTMSGSTLVPGTLEVEVFADSAGEEYNTSNVDFTIPGFAGREQFEKITAQSVTDITGGYIGIRKVVSEEAKKEAQKNLEAELRSQIEKTQTQSTEYIIVPDITTLTYGEIQDKVEGDSVVLSLSASVDAYSFVKKELFDFLGQNTLAGASSTDSFTLDSGLLTFAVDKDIVKITGSAPIIWVTDTEQLKKDFLNKKRSEVVEVINSYHSFEKAEANLSPFWKTRFPSDISKINVVITK